MVMAKNYTGPRPLILPPDEYFTTNAQGNTLVCLAGNGELVAGHRSGLPGRDPQGARRASDATSPAAPADGDRLAKVIARAGLCSRRDAEGWIKDGRVSVNGTTIRTPAFNVAAKDEIKVDGRTARRARRHPRLALSQARRPRGHREGPRGPRDHLREARRRGPAARPQRRPARHQHRRPAAPHQ